MVTSNTIFVTCLYTDMIISSLSRHIFSSRFLVFRHSIKLRWRSWRRRSRRRIDKLKRLSEKSRTCTRRSKSPFHQFAAFGTALKQYIRNHFNSAFLMWSCALLLVFSGTRSPLSWTWPWRRPSRSSWRARCRRSSILNSLRSTRKLPHGTNMRSRRRTRPSHRSVFL